MFKLAGLINLENYEWNILIFRFINEHNSPLFDTFFFYARFLGRGEIIFLILLILIFTKRKDDFLRFLIASLLTATMVILLKNLFSQPRPALLLGDVHLLLPYYKNSFPSGDTAVASLILLFFFNKVGIVFKFLLIIYWLIISYGRIYLGVHFPVDILGGLLIAFLCIIVSNVMMNKWQVPKIE